MGIDENLIYDVGLHRGEDSAFYLAMGYRVVAFEADPHLAAVNRARFSLELSEGRLEIVEGAISDSSDETIAFYRHPANSVWGTIDATWAERNEPRGRSVRTEVPVVDFPQVLRDRGVPFFMKVDIEGADRLCIESLQALSERPPFLSIESEKESWEALVAEIEFLQSLGYTRFVESQQEGMHRAGPRPVTDFAGQVKRYKFEKDSSGPFGDDLAAWCSAEEVLLRYKQIFNSYRRWGDRSLAQRTVIGRVLLKAFARLRGRPLPGWFDTHARLDGW